MNKIKVLLVGSTGLLGHDIYRVLSSSSIIDLKTLNRSECDITKKNHVIASIATLEFDYLINATAYAKVDDAENEIDLCYEVNVRGVKNLLDICIEKNSIFVHFSSDYIFDGTLDRPYLESDKPNPISVYGTSKLKSEQLVKQYPKHFIIRTSWLYGINGENFVSKILKITQNRAKLKVVSDQVGSPTYTWDVAKFLESLIDNRVLVYGTYNVTNEGYISWFEFAQLIFKSTNTNIEIQPVNSSEFQMIAKRPRNSCLDTNKIETLNIHKMPTIINALNRYLVELEISQ